MKAALEDTWTCTSPQSRVAPVRRLRLYVDARFERTGVAATRRRRADVSRRLQRPLRLVEHALRRTRAHGACARACERALAAVTAGRKCHAAAPHVRHPQSRSTDPRIDNCQRVPAGSDTRARHTGVRARATIPVPAGLKLPVTQASRHAAPRRRCPATAPAWRTSWRPRCAPLCALARVSCATHASCVCNAYTPGEKSSKPTHLALAAAGGRRCPPLHTLAAASQERVAHTLVRRPAHPQRRHHHHRRRRRAAAGERGRAVPAH